MSSPCIEVIAKSGYKTNANGTEEEGQKGGEHVRKSNPPWSLPSRSTNALHDDERPQAATIIRTIGRGNRRRSEWAL